MSDRHASTVFEFERDFAQSLRCVPMSVRLKLDVAGVKISLKQWNRLTTEDRQQLLLLACDTSAEKQEFGERVRAMLAARASDPAGQLAVDAHPAWAREDQVPEPVARHLRSLKLPALSVAQWRDLSQVQRFSLMKLSRAGHDNDNFVPALREFGLLPDTTPDKGAETA